MRLKWARAARAALAGVSGSSVSYHRGGGGGVGGGGWWWGAKQKNMVFSFKERLKTGGRSHSDWFSSR